MRELSSPPAAAPLRTGDDDAHRKTTASRSPPPPPCSPLCQPMQQRPSARLFDRVRLPPLPCTVPLPPSQRHTHFSFSPIQCHYTTILLRASGSARTTPRHRCCLLLQSSPRSHCDSRPSARVPGWWCARVLGDPGSAARWPGVEAAAVPRRSTTTSRRTPSRTSSLGSPTASPALPRGVSLPVPSRRFLLLLLLLRSAQLTCRRSSTQL